MTLLKMISGAWLVAWGIVFALWLRALVAYVKCNRENQQTNRECRQYIREMNESLCVRLQSQGGIICNLRNSDPKNGHGNLALLPIDADTI